MFARRKPNLRRDLAQANQILLFNFTPEFKYKEPGLAANSVNLQSETYKFRPQNPYPKNAKLSVKKVRV